MRALVCYALRILIIFSAVNRVEAGDANFMMDARTGQVLAESSADSLNHPASLAKMMTLYLTFEALQTGRLRWEQQLPVSRHASNQVPTKLGIRAGEKITVREAVLGMIVVSGNDAAVVVAEELAGSEKAFARIMTARAHNLGMRRTVFRNASGLPDRQQVTTAREMALLGIALMRDFPAEYGLFRRRAMKFRGRSRYGHNRLLSSYAGVDGIKTGYTNWSGFNLVTSAELENRRVVGVVMGGDSANDRDRKMAGLLDQYLPLASNANSSDGLLQPLSITAVYRSLRPVPRPGRGERTGAVVRSLRPAPRPASILALNRPLNEQIENAVRAALQ